jgi:hypothetical protein
MARFIKFMLILVLALGAVMPTHAQDGGLTDEQQALLDRVLNALAASADYTSYTTEFGGTETQTTTLVIGDQSQEETTNTLFVREGQYIADVEGGPNLIVAATAQVGGAETRGTNSQITAYTVTAEMRYVGGVFYVNATRQVELAPDLPPMPEGWVVVESADEWPALEDVDLGNIMDELDHPAVGDEELAGILTHASSVTMVAGTLEDGTPVDIITITLASADLSAGMIAAAEAQGQEPITISLMGMLDETSVATVIVSLTADDQIVQATQELTISWTNLDLKTLNPDAPEGVLFSQKNVTSGTLILTNINAALEPVPAPEM